VLHADSTHRRLVGVPSPPDGVRNLHLHCGLTTLKLLTIPPGSSLAVSQLGESRIALMLARTRFDTLEQVWSDKPQM
jgi:hypothetical protein